jgi:hypothetical protein
MSDLGRIWKEAVTVPLKGTVPAFAWRNWGKPPNNVNHLCDLILTMKFVTDFPTS